jgi:peptide chain release factor 1
LNLNAGFFIAQTLFMRDKIENILSKFRSLEHEMASAASDRARLTELGKERKRMEPIVQAAEEFARLDDELRSLDEMMKSPDASMVALAQEEKPTLEQKVAAKRTELEKLLKPRDPRADRNVIVEIRAGAGGDEAGLFVADLFRMYSRFAQRKALNLAVYDSSPTGVGGLKEIIFQVSGVNAYGWFHLEQGVHRVQRVPATEAQGRIHTSTVTVAVLPEPTEVEINVDVKDLRIDTYRASGAGGQHVNKTDSAIRITHIPTGIVVL